MVKLRIMMLVLIVISQSLDIIFAMVCLVNKEDSVNSNSYAKCISCGHSCIGLMICVCLTPC